MRQSKTMTNGKKLLLAASIAVCLVALVVALKIYYQGDESARTDDASQSTSSVNDDSGFKGGGGKFRGKGATGTW